MSKRIPKTIISFEHNYYLDEDVFKMVNKLEQENKQLKKHHIFVRPYTNDEVREKIDNNIDTIKQLFKTIIDKQQRIDKAIDYIKSNELDIVMVELLEILGDKENE